MFLSKQELINLTNKERFPAQILLTFNANYDLLKIMQRYHDVRLKQSKSLWKHDIDEYATTHNPPIPTV